MPYPDWVVDVDDRLDPRKGVRVRHLISGNDGDICIAMLTEILLRNMSSPHFMDIGAHHGWWSFFVLDSHPDTQVEAFEPNPFNCSEMEVHTRKNPRIKLHNIAVSDKNDWIPLTIDGPQSHSRGMLDSGLLVECERIDHYIHDKVIEIIKIDTEGHELTILKTLEPYYDKINNMFVEFTPYWYGNTREEMVANSLAALNTLSEKYQTMAHLSRRETPPQIFPLEKAEFVDFINNCIDNHISTDIFVSKGMIL